MIYAARDFHHWLGESAHDAAREENERRRLMRIEPEEQPDG